MVDDKHVQQLNERAQHLFKCLVERYVADGQPVGSRTLARDARLDLSPATIRNVMADLEDLGLISSPHTSAGRVPTVRGYRLFVDSLLTYREPAQSDVQYITEQLESEEDIKRLLQTTSEMLSRVTKLAGLVMIPRTEQRAYRHVEFLPLNDNRVLVILVFSDREVQNRVIQTERAFAGTELLQAANYLNSTFAGKDVRVVKEELLRELRKAHEEMNRTMQAVIEVTQKALEAGDEQGEGYLLAGQTNLMEIGEWSSIDRLRQLFDAFSQKRDILQLLDQAMNARGIQIFFGEESGYGALDHCSVVTSTYEDENRTIGVLGVIGPTRMEYDRVIPIVRVTARMLSSALKSLS